MGQFLAACGVMMVTLGAAAFIVDRNPVNKTKPKPKPKPKPIGPRHAAQ